MVGARPLWPRLLSMRPALWPLASAVPLACRVAASALARLTNPAAPGDAPRRGVWLLVWVLVWLLVWLQDAPPV